MTDHVKCPYCKAKYDVTEYYEDGSEIVDCGECEKKFTINTSVSIDHDSESDCVDNDELPHHLIERTYGGGLLYFDCTKCTQTYYAHSMPGGKYAKLVHGKHFIFEKDIVNSDANQTKLEGV
jgi:Zn ribbon nucleic-acid-binding protein